VVVTASAQLAGADVRQRRRQNTEHHLHLSADQIGNGRRLTAIGDVDQGDAGHHLEQLGRNVKWRSDSGQCHIDLARIGLGIGDELRNRLGRKRRIDLQGQGDSSDVRHRGGVEGKIESKVVVERRVDGVGRHGKQQCVAVRRRANDRFGADVAAGARPIVGDELLAQPLR